MASESLAWTLFKVDTEDSTKSVCIIGNQKVSRGTKSGYLTTTNMLKHSIWKANTEKS